MKNQPRSKEFIHVLRPDVPHDALKEKARAWFSELRDQICTSLEAIEDEAEEANSPVLGERTEAARFKREVWTREAEEGASLNGGGVMSILRGRVFEKVGVNISTVWGEFSPDYRKMIPGAENDPRFFATGISLVAHPCNPHVSAAHFNTRLIITSKGWFGGGGDITPMFPQVKSAQDDAAMFHNALKAACDKHDPTYYAEFKAWCDRYFYLPHRQEPRGLGGIFFDHHDRRNPENDFLFTQDVGRAFSQVYPAIVRQRMLTPWTQDDREAQLIRRGRYVEFNLIHDRGTLFGLKTGGHIEAILMSLPPEVKWP